jgi:rod shape-determining protein MreD
MSAVSLSFWRLCLMTLMLVALTVVSLPNVLAMFRPLWIVCLMLYIQVTFPRHFHMIGVLMLGIVLDVLCATVLGEHAFALSLVAWCVSGRVKRFKFFTMIQQMAWVLGLSTIYQLTMLILNVVFGHMNGALATMLPVLLTTLMWPVFKTILDRVLILSPKRYYSAPFLK